MSRKVPVALVALAWLVPAGVLIQAVLAGQSLFAGAGLFGLHGGIGHGVLALSVVTAGAAWITKAPRTASVLASLGVLAIVAQTGLGYAGLRGGIAVAAALHIPLGVTVFGLAAVVATLLSLHRRVVTRRAPRVRHRWGGNLGAPRPRRPDMSNDQGTDPDVSGESTTSSGEDVAKSDKEAGREDKGRKGQSDRPEGDSSARDSTGIDPQEPIDPDSPNLPPA